MNSNDDYVTYATETRHDALALQLEGSLSYAQSRPRGLGGDGRAVECIQLLKNTLGSVGILPCLSTADNLIKVKLSHWK